MSAEVILAGASLLAGGVAAVSGFGIGSILTPVLALWWETKLAVALVAIPHVSGTALRLWLLRRQIDRRVLWSFGAASAAGGLVGAGLHVWFDSVWLRMVLAGLLVFAGIMGLTGLGARFRFTGGSVWPAGALSGLLGGLVGSQGGIRTAAMLGLDVPREAFIATTTAVALMIDGARTPVYLAAHAGALRPHLPAIGLMTGGVLAGTLIGFRVLRRLNESLFRRVVSGLILALGIFLLLKGGA